MLHDVLVIVGALALLVVGAAVLGGFGIAMLYGPGVDAAEIFYDDEPTVQLPPVETVVAHRPMSAMERLEGPTRRIIRNSEGYQVEPWWMGGRHRVPESRLRTAPYVLAPNEIIPTMEFPLLDWSARTEELTQVYQGGDR